MQNLTRQSPYDIIQCGGIAQTEAEDKMEITLSIPHIVPFLLAGGVGGLIRGLIGFRKARMTNPQEKISWPMVLFDFCFAMILGAILGIFINNDWRTSFLAGYGGFDLLESLFKIKFNTNRNGAA